MSDVIRVRMLTLMAGPDGVRQVGEEVDLPRAQAVELVRGRYAVVVRGARMERATLPPGEIAAPGGVALEGEGYAGGLKEVGDQARSHPSPKPKDEVRTRTLEELLGREAAEELEVIGVRSVEDLRAVGVGELVKIRGVGKATAKKWKGLAG